MGWMDDSPKSSKDLARKALRRTSDSSGKRVLNALDDWKPIANPRAVQLLLGHTKIESTVRYLGIEVDDAFAICTAPGSTSPVGRTFLDRNT
jgi:hypothetical protein